MTKSPPETERPSQPEAMDSLTPTRWSLLLVSTDQTIYQARQVLARSVKLHARNIGYPAGAVDWHSVLLEAYRIEMQSSSRR